MSTSTFWLWVEPCLFSFLRQSFNQEHKHSTHLRDIRVQKRLVSNVTAKPHGLKLKKKNGYNDTLSQALHFFIKLYNPYRAGLRQRRCHAVPLSDTYKTCRRKNLPNWFICSVKTTSSILEYDRPAGNDLGTSRDGCINWRHFAADSTRMAGVNDVRFVCSSSMLL